ncbi:c-type cytochrome [Amaricoccus solimangrovi]|uniref:Cytochrome C n=1 Tax=Amaricoccus solimangrovi TaxID=2589815 RepID=A0A501WSS0_9RHOB|nr:cytochrome c [Amaricoccus solimangrovi]TPE51892.1 cytochrome C [Amaricoccus solimangrovi]
MRGISIGLGLALSCMALSGAGPISPHASYALHCSGCHTMSGGGAPEAGIPDFRNSVGNIAGSEAGRTYMMHVPGVVSAGLTDAEIAEVMNYVLDAWGAGASPFTAAEVTRRRAVAVGDVVAERRRVAAELSGAGIPTAQYPWP